jgi:hypothetical protein
MRIESSGLRIAILEREDGECGYTVMQRALR